MHKNPYKDCCSGFYMQRIYKTACFDQTLWPQQHVERWSVKKSLGTWKGRIFGSSMARFSSGLEPRLPRAIQQKPQPVQRRLISNHSGIQTSRCSLGGLNDGWWCLTDLVRSFAAWTALSKALLASSRFEVEHGWRWKRCEKDLHFFFCNSARFALLLIAYCFTWPQPPTPCWEDEGVGGAIPPTETIHSSRIPIENT